MTDPLSARTRELLAAAVANLGEGTTPTPRDKSSDLSGFLSSVRIGSGASNPQQTAQRPGSSRPVSANVSGATASSGLPPTPGRTLELEIARFEALANGGGSTSAGGNRSTTLNTRSGVSSTAAGISGSSSSASSSSGRQRRSDSELDALVNGVLDTPTSDRTAPVNQEPLDPEDAAAEGLGAAALIRYQKAKLATLRESQATLLARVAQMEADAAAQQNKLKSAMAEIANLQRRVAAAEAVTERYKKSAADAAARVMQLEKDVTAYKRDIEKSEKARQALEQESKQRDAKLNRALLDADRARARLSQVKDTDREVSSSVRNEITKLQNENKRLMQQKQDLFKAFKCQFKLIENLKKQLVHVEAARLLAFTEEEFARALQIDSVVGSGAE